MALHSLNQNVINLATILAAREQRCGGKRGDEEEGGYAALHVLLLRNGKFLDAFLILFNNTHNNLF